jgi:3-deoxy-7-phosphoheptulonate synthase
MNPNNIPGRLTIIVIMGAEKRRKNLPGLVRAVQREGKSVLWNSDPVHGNTFRIENGFKTHSFDAIREKLRAFFDVHDEMGSHLGGNAPRDDGQRRHGVRGGPPGAGRKRSQPEVPHQL